MRRRADPGSSDRGARQRGEHVQRWRRELTDRPLFSRGLWAALTAGVGVFFTALFFKRPILRPHGEFIVRKESFDFQQAQRRCEHMQGTNGTQQGNSEATNVWCKLVGAGVYKGQCSGLDCTKGKHMHTDISDFGKEMFHVRGAVVLRRPGLASTAESIWPANNLDFVKTFQAYYPLFESTLFDRLMVEEPRIRTLWQIPGTARFLDAIIEGDDTAAKYLSPYYALPKVEIRQEATRGYEAIPSVVGIADVYISPQGYIFNEKLLEPPSAVILLNLDLTHARRTCSSHFHVKLQDYIVPKSCKSEKLSKRSVPRPTAGIDGYAQVLVVTQHWSDKYYHFFTECLPRMTIMLDVLRAYPDIKIAVGNRPEEDRAQVEELVELIGIDRSRVIFNTEIHADLVILPESTACGQPNTLTIALLRTALLEGLYPATRGVPPPVLRPTILLIVRTKSRQLDNSAEVRDALKANFPTHDVVEFFGNCSMREQLDIFARTSLLVAPHGAGLSNMIVSPLHTPVLEIGPPACPTCYLHLAVKLQHIFARHSGGLAWDFDCNRGFTPNVEELISLVRSLFEAQQLADAADPVQGMKWLEASV